MFFYPSCKISHRPLNVFFFRSQRVFGGERTLFAEVCELHGKLRVLVLHGVWAQHRRQNMRRYVTVTRSSQSFLWPACKSVTDSNKSVSYVTSSDWIYIIHCTYEVRGKYHYFFTCMLSTLHCSKLAFKDQGILKVKIKVKTFLKVVYYTQMVFLRRKSILILNAFTRNVSL